MATETRKPRPIRDNELIPKLRVLSSLLESKENDIKTVHPVYLITKGGNRKSTLEREITSIKIEIQIIKKRLKAISKQKSAKVVNA